MLPNIERLTVPLRADASGTLRVGETRVSLDVVVAAFRAGASVEEIAQEFPTLALDDIYTVIAYYLRHTEAVDGYLRDQERDAAEVRRAVEARQHPDPLRARLLARRGKPTS